jgi:hypothetical protein
LNRTGAGSFGAADGLFGSISFGGAGNTTKAGGKEPSNRASTLVGADLAAAVLGSTLVNPLAAPATTTGPALATVPASPLAGVQSVDQLFSSTEDHGFVAAGAKPAASAGDALVSPLAGADDALSLG